MNFFNRVFGLWAFVISSLFITSSVAQFSLRHKQQKLTMFQKLNEQAEQQQEKEKEGNATGDPSGWADIKHDLGDKCGVMNILNEFMEDPDIKQLLNDGMQELSQMSPEEFQESMKAAFGDAMDVVLEERDELIELLESFAEETGLVPLEEIEKYKKDPKYFESKMRETHDEIKSIFEDPEVYKTACDAMREFGNCQSIFEGENKAFLESINGNEIQNSLDGNLELPTMFKSDEIQGDLKDPTKWKPSAKKE